MLPKMTTTIHSICINLSLAMASTMTLVSSIFGAKVDKAIIRSNNFAMGMVSQMTSTIADLLDLCLT
jgi:hypothetical protein